MATFGLRWSRPSIPRGRRADCGMGTFVRDLAKAPRTPRFRRALDTRQRDDRVLPRPPISTSSASRTRLELVLLLVDDPGRFRRAALRWHARYCAEVPDVGFDLRGGRGRRARCAPPHGCMTEDCQPLTAAAPRGPRRADEHEAFVQETRAADLPSAWVNRPSSSSGPGSSGRARCCGLPVPSEA